MGEYENGDLQKVFDSPGPLTDIVHSTRLNAQEQRELQGRMEKKQMKEFMTVSLSILCALPCFALQDTQLSPWLTTFN